MRVEGGTPCRRDGRDVRKTVRKRQGKETKNIPRSLRSEREDLFDDTKKVDAQEPGKGGEESQNKKSCSTI